MVTVRVKREEESDTRIIVNIRKRSERKEAAGYEKKGFQQRLTAKVLL